MCTHPEGYLKPQLRQRPRRRQTGMRFDSGHLALEVLVPIEPSPRRVLEWQLRHHAPHQELPSPTPRCSFPARIAPHFHLLQLASLSCSCDARCTRQPAQGLVPRKRLSSPSGPVGGSSNRAPDGWRQRPRRRHLEGSGAAQTEPGSSCRTGVGTRARTHFGQEFGSLAACRGAPRWLRVTTWGLRGNCPCSPTDLPRV